MRVGIVKSDATFVHRSGRYVWRSGLIRPTWHECRMTSEINVEKRERKRGTYQIKKLELNLAGR